MLLHNACASSPARAGLVIVLGASQEDVPHFMVDEVRLIPPQTHCLYRVVVRGNRAVPPTPLINPDVPVVALCGRHAAAAVGAVALHDLPRRDELNDNVAGAAAIREYELYTGCAPPIAGEEDVAHCASEGLLADAHAVSREAIHCYLSLYWRLSHLSWWVIKKMYYILYRSSMPQSSRRRLAAVQAALKKRSHSHSPTFERFKETLKKDKLKDFARKAVVAATFMGLFVLIFAGVWIWLDNPDVKNTIGRGDYVGGIMMAWASAQGQLGESILLQSESLWGRVLVLCGGAISSLMVIYLIAD